MSREIVESDPMISFTADTFRLPERFSAINRMVMQDLNGRRPSQKFLRYTKDEIASYLANPYSSEKQLRQAVVYLYGASPHFRRLIQYFVSLSDLSYVVSPFKIDTTTANEKTTYRNYRRVLNALAAMDIKNQFEKILTVCLREDTFYGTIRDGADSTIIQQLPSDYCQIAVIEDNVFNVSFDFSYFSANPDFLALYPEEFRTKYERYKNDRVHMRWQELDTPNSFAIKANKEIPAYAMPPFVGILRDIYDLEDYRVLKMTKTELENYALLVMNLPMNRDGEWLLDYGKATKFWSNLDEVLPEEIGSVLSPMEINKISFERNKNGDSDTIAEAENNLFTAAGVSSLLFNNAKASANALILSIKADQSITYSIVKSIECMLNRYLHRKGFGKYFKVTFLDCSRFNRDEVGKAYLTATTYGMPTISYYMASQGISQDELDSMNYLEDRVLKLKERLQPLRNSATLSAEDTTSDGGRPKSDMGDLTESGEVSQERGEQ